MHKNRFIGPILIGMTLFAGLAVAAADQTSAAPARPQLKAAAGEAKYFMAPALAKDLISPGQSTEEQARADAAWAHLFDPVDGRSLAFVDQNGKPSNLMLGDLQRRKGPDWQRDPKEIAWTQRAKLALRERGLTFWDEYPQDVRRYVWLYQTALGYPYYWKDVDAGARAFSAWLNDRASRALSTVAFDHEAQASWEIRYLSMRSQFMASTLLEPSAKHALRRNELEQRLFLDLQGNKIPDALTEAQVALRWTAFFRDLMDLADLYPGQSAGYTPSSAVSLLETEAKTYPTLYPLLKKEFLAAAKLSASDDLKDYAFAASEEPVEIEIGKPAPGLKFTTLRGQNVDRRVWHGKVVLVDFWAFWCHSCIEAMPHLKTLYDKYRDQGFEIYGVCFAEKGETPQKIVDLMQKMGIPWEQSMRESLRNDRFGRIYGFTSLPQLMLLDRQGNLAAQNLYDPAALEEKITELLK